MKIEEIIKNYVNENKNIFRNKYFSHHINPEDSFYFIDFIKTNRVKISWETLQIEPLIIDDDNYILRDLSWILHCCLKDIDLTKRSY